MPAARYHEPNSLDYVLFAGDAALRAGGLPGSNCLGLFCLEGRVDVVGLRRAIAALYDVHPVANARLVQSGPGRRPRWRLGASQPDWTRALVVHEIPPTGTGAVHAAAEELLNQPLDPTREPPVQWHVLRAPDGNDVVAIRWPHPLMDAKGGELFHVELNRLYHEPGHAVVEADGADDPITAWINRCPRRQQRRLLRETVRNRPPSDPPPATLAQPSSDQPPGRYRYSVRTLDADAHGRVRQNAAACCGLGGLSAYQAASALRAMQRTLRCDATANLRFSTRWLMSLRPPRNPRGMFFNAFSFVPLEVGPEEVADRNAVACRFADRIRPALRAQIRLGQRPSRRRERDQAATNEDVDPSGLPFLLVTRAARRLPFWLLRSHRLRAAFGATPPALPMSQIGPFVKPLETFCNCRVRNYLGMFTVPPTRGYTLQINEFNGQLNLLLAYLDGRVDERTADAYLDLLVADLLEDQ